MCGLCRLCCLVVLVVGFWGWVDLRCFLVCRDGVVVVVEVVVELEVEVEVEFEVEFKLEALEVVEVELLEELAVAELLLGVEVVLAVDGHDLAWSTAP